jgi:hypothetical protein
MLLLLWLPLVIWLLRVHVALALAVSTGVWAGAGLMHLNLPSYPDDYGWVFNPMAWQLLFTIGAAGASYSRTSGSSTRLGKALIWVAAAYVLFALLVAAPWANVPGLNEFRAVPDFRTDLSKQYLSPWRLAHILALAVLAASLIPVRASWLSHRLAAPLIMCGRHSLPVFCLSIVLSLTGFVVLVEAGHGLVVQVIVNLVGVTLLGMTAWILTRLQARKGRGHPDWARAQASGEARSPS